MSERYTATLKCVESEFVGLFVVELCDGGMPRYYSRQFADDETDAREKINRDALAWVETGDAPDDQQGWYEI